MPMNHCIKKMIHRRSAVAQDFGAILEFTFTPHETELPAGL